MALTPFTSTISESALNNNNDDKTVSLLSNAKAGKKDSDVHLRLASLAAGADLSLRSVAWTQQDDQELRVVLLRVADTTASRVVRVRLEVANGDATYIAGQTITTTVTTIVGTADTRLDVRTVTGVRVRLLRGVRYRLSVENETAATTTGVVEADVQLRSRRRSVGPRTQIPFVPRRFRNTENLDVEALNDDLEAIARDVQANLEQRYTYGPPIILDLDGVTNASTAVLRELAIRRVGNNNGLEICAMELVVYAAGTVVWTLTCSDTSAPSITVTSAGATTEAHAHLEVSVPASFTSDVTFTASAPKTSTITRGYIVIHTRCDRGNQGTSHAGYTPTLLDAASARDGATLDAEYNGLEAAANRDAANDVDLRVECYAVRSLASGSSVTFRLPSGARRILGTVAYVVGAAGSTATCTVTGTNLVGSSVAPTSTGAANRVAATDAASGTMPDNPTASADDATVTIAISGGVTADLAYVLVFWS